MRKEKGVRWLVDRVPSWEALASKERPTFELKLRSAEDFVNAEKLYFPHNMDFRGRCYPLPFPAQLTVVDSSASRGLEVRSGTEAAPESHGGRCQPRIADVLGFQAFGERRSFLVKGRHSQPAWQEQDLARRPGEMG